MRNISLSWVVSIGLWLGACTGVGFEQPQPAGFPDLKEIPMNLRGTYADDDNDSLVVGNDQMVYYGMNQEIQFSIINQNLAFRPWDGYWVINFRENKFWDVFLCKYYGDSLEAMYIPGRQRQVIDADFDWMKQHAQGHTIDPDESDGVYEFVVNPDSAAFRQMVQKGLFKANLSLKKKR
ncbi:MAG: hypothetical protein ACP5O2_03010 [Bacteroidales bacterium]